MCEECINHPEKTICTISSRVSEMERQHFQLQSICKSCTSQSAHSPAPVECFSIDCPIVFAKSRLDKEMVYRSKLESALEVLKD